jgi:glutaconyl-CoA/methylmalonyl-CoA decarboxylase subunit gamma
MKEVTITVNCKSYAVKVGDLNTSPVHVEVNGKPYMVEMELPEVVEAQAVQNIQAVASAPVAKRSTTPAPKPQPAGESGKSVNAPMPGTIVLITAKVGDNIKRGDNLLSLEAMKMKNAIRAPFDGVIKEIHVVDGQKVAYNDVLVSFE